MRSIIVAGSALLLASLGHTSPPTLVGTYTNGLDANHVRAHHSTSNVCVAAFVQAQSFQVIAATNAAAPWRRGGLALPHSGDRLGLSADERVACMVGFFGGMKVLSVTNPAAPVLLGTYSTPGPGMDVALSANGGLAFLALDSAGVEVVSLASPAAPQRIGGDTVNFSGSAGALGVALSPDERLLYVAAGSAGVRVLSVANPAAPALAGSYSPSLVSPIRGVHVAPAGDRLFTLGGGSTGELGLRVLSLANPVMPSFTGGYVDPFRSGAFADLALSEDGCTAFVVGNNVGLQVVDVTPGLAPLFVAEFYEIINALAPQARGVDLSRNEAVCYVAEGVNGLRFVDVSGVYDLDDDGLPNSWERQHFDSLTGAEAGVDSDGDGHLNTDEYISGSDPRDIASVFRATSVAVAGQARVGVSSLQGRAYSLEYRDAPLATATWHMVDSALAVPGSGGPLMLTDTHAAPSRFYRVTVQMAR